MRIDQKPPSAQLHCALCGELYAESALELHEIVTRGMINNKDLLDTLPVELHALVCHACHGGDTEGQPDAHSAEGRRRLIAYAVRLWGKRALRDASAALNDRLPRPLPARILNYDLYGGEPCE